MQDYTKINWNVSSKSSQWLVT